MDFVKRIGQKQSEHTVFLIAEQAFRLNFPGAKIIGVDGVFNFLYMDKTVPHLIAIIDYSFETEERQCLKGKKYNKVRICVRLRTHRDFSTWIPVEVVEVDALDEITQISITEFLVKTDKDALKKWIPQWELVPLLTES